MPPREPGRLSQAPIQLITTLGGRKRLARGIEKPRGANEVGVLVDARAANSYPR
jgi:hypothetical protein